MKKIIYSFLIGVLLLSCEKKDNSELKKNLRLKELIEYNGIADSRIVYHYDSLNRLTEYEFFFIEDDGLKRGTKYFYYQNKLDSFSSYWCNYSTKWKFNYYNDTIDARILTYDTVIGRCVYITSQEQIQKEINFTATNNDSLYPFQYDVIHWVDNNLIQLDRSYIQAAVEPNSRTIYYEYDNLRNPFIEINVNVHFGSYKSSKNNLTRLIEVTSAGDSLINSYTYTYNEYGLPIQRIDSLAYPDPSTLITNIYIYEEF